MNLSSADFSAIWLTLKLASLTTLILLVVGTPIALWLSRTGSWLRGPIGAVVALPLVLPPTVIGFYLLLALGPNGFFGQLTQSLGLGTLTFVHAVEHFEHGVDLLLQGPGVGQARVEAVEVHVVLAEVVLDGAAVE